MMTHSDREFFLSFYLTEQPTVLSAEEIEHLEAVDTVAVAKVIVTPELARAIIRAIEQNIEKFDRVQKWQQDNE